VTSRLAAATAATSLAALALLGMGAPASAQSYDDQTSPGASDETVVLNQTFTITTGDGECDPGTAVAVAIRGNNFSDDETTTADSDGTATIEYTVPPEAEEGDATATFTCLLDGETNTIVVAFTVVASDSDDGGTNGGQDSDDSGTGALPRTGSDNLVALSAGGAALVALGAGMVMVARRRREGVPGSMA
jgi:LPXTG-motif cell wall-anchored protein